jgi:flagellar biosynthesis chaperone FliJ
LNLLRGILPEEQAERVATEMATLLGEMVQAEVARQLETLIRELRADYHRIDERLARLVQVTEQHSEQIARLVQVTEQHSVQIAELRATTERHSEQIAENTRAIAELRAIVEKHSEQIAENTRAIERLERVVEDLVKAEQRLTRRTDDIARQLGGMAMDLGYLLENDAYESLPPLLERDYGVRVLTPLTRDFVEDDKGNEYEVNIFGEGERDGERVLIVGECKTQLSKQEIDRFLRRKIKPVQRIFSGRAVFPVMVGHAVTSKQVQRYAQERGVAVYLSYQFRRSSRQP